MLPSEVLAIAARLHVMLRRKTGRVTDTEWMAVNQEYAAEVVRFSRQRAVDPGNEELAEWATRLEMAMAALARAPVRGLAPRPVPPPAAPVQLAAPSAPGAESWADGDGADSLFAPPVSPEPAPKLEPDRYIGRLR